MDLKHGKTAVLQQYANELNEPCVTVGNLQAVQCGEHLCYNFAMKRGKTEISIIGVLHT